VTASLSMWVQEWRKGGTALKGIQKSWMRSRELRHREGTFPHRDHVRERGVKAMLDQKRKKGHVLEGFFGESESVELPPVLNRAENRGNQLPRGGEEQC